MKISIPFRSFRLGVLTLLLIGAGASRAQILTKGDFEEGNLDKFKLQAATPAALTVVTSPVRAGHYAARSILHASDPIVHNGQRAEFVDHTPVPLHRPTWYALSIFLGPDFAVPPAKDGILLQFHQNANGDSPVLAFRVVNHVWQITTNAAGKRRLLAELPLEKDKWVDWVLRVSWAGDATGEWTIWKDGVQVVQETKVVTTYAAETAGPYAKFGQYHTVYEAAENTAYFDEYKLAGPESTYANVAPEPPKAAGTPAK